MKYIVGLVLIASIGHAQNNCDPCNVTAEQRACVKKSVKPRTKVVYVDKVVEHEKVVKETVTVVEKAPIKRHNLSLLAGTSFTDARRSQPDSNTYKVENHREVDLGLMYQYNFTDKVRGSVIGTKNSTALLGLGLNF